MIWAIFLEPRSNTNVSTGMRISIPQAFFGQIVSCSGNSFNNAIEVGAGIIDSGFLGQIHVKLYNHSDNFIVIQKNAKIAQIIFQPFLNIPELSHNPSLFQNSSSDRNKNGLGSSNKPHHIQAYKSAEALNPFKQSIISDYFKPSS